MSTTEREHDEVPVERASFHEFELSCVVDDEAHPAEVTVFPAERDEELGTRWISVDADHAVPIEETC